MRASTQEKRIRIIQVATELFIEQGYKNTSLDQIVAICGGSKQTIYRYFSNKEGLFIEVLAFNIKSSVESVFHLVKNQNEAIKVRLEAFAIQYLKGMCSKPMLGLFRIIAADFNKHDAVSLQFWQTGPVRVHQYLIDFLTSSDSCRSLKIDDPKLACDQLLALIKLDFYSKALLGIELPNDEQLHQHAQQAVQTFLSLHQRQKDN